MTRYLNRSKLFLSLLLLLPIALYLMIAAQMSWRPRILLIDKDTNFLSWRSDSKALAVLTRSDNENIKLKLWDTNKSAIVGDLVTDKSLANRTDLALNDLFEIYWDYDIALTPLFTKKNLHRFRNDIHRGLHNSVSYHNSKVIGVSEDNEEKDKFTVITADTNTLKQNLIHIDASPPLYFEGNTSCCATPPPDVVFSPYGRWGAAVLYKDGKPHLDSPRHYSTPSIVAGLMLFNPLGGAQSHVLPIFQDKTSASMAYDNVTMAFSHDEHLVAVVTDFLELWDTTTGLRQLRIKTDAINTLDQILVFSPDDTLIATVRENIVRLWDVKTGALYRELKDRSDRVNSIAFSPDGTTLATGGDDGTVKLWRIK